MISYWSGADEAYHIDRSDDVNFKLGFFCQTFNLLKINYWIIIDQMTPNEL